MIEQGDYRAVCAADICIIAKRGIVVLTTMPLFAMQLLFFSVLRLLFMILHSVYNPLYQSVTFPLYQRHNQYIPYNQ